MKKLAMLLALTAAVQESDLDRRVSELIRRVEEGDAKAAQELADIGPAALEAIRREAARMEAAKARLLDAAHEIERRERLKEFDGPPARITLKAEGRPLSEVVDDIARQSGIRIALAAAKADAVTVDLEGVPLLEALDRVCRAHGKTTLRLSRAPGEEALTIGRGVPGRTPRSYEDGFAVELTSILLTRSSDFGAGRLEEMRLQFAAAWDPATRPIAARLVLTELVDDKGTSLIEDAGPTRSDGGTWRRPPRRYAVNVGRLPSPGAAALRTVAGLLELSYPADVEVLKIERPAGKADVAAKGSHVSLRLVRFARAGRGWAARIETTRGLDFENCDLAAFDAAGKSIPARVTGSGEDDTKYTYDLAFPAGDGTEPAELRLTVPVGRRTRKIPWKFEDVPIR